MGAPSALARERGAADEAELLAMQAEFERAGRAPAATVIRVGGGGGGGHGEEQGGSAAEAAEATGAAARTVPHEPAQQAPFAPARASPAGKSRTAMAEGLAVGSIRERASTDRSREKVAWVPGTGGGGTLGGVTTTGSAAFPRAVHRSVRSFGRRSEGRSAFARQKQATAAAGASGERGLPAAAAAAAGTSSGREAAAIDKENVGRLAAMGAAERQEAMEEVEAVLDESTLRFLRERGAKKAAKGGSGVVPVTVTEKTSQRECEAVQRAPASSPAPEPELEDAASEQHRGAQPPTIDWPTLRFALSGEPLSTAATNSSMCAVPDGVRATERDPLRMGAHAAGDAGYTFAEALTLARSAVPAQRVAALRLLAGAVARARARAEIVGALQLRGGGCVWGVRTGGTMGGGEDMEWEVAVLHGCASAGAAPAALACVALADNHAAVVSAGAALALELVSCEGDASKFARGHGSIAPAADMLAACAALPMAERTPYGEGLKRKDAHASWTNDTKGAGSSSIEAMLELGVVELCANIAQTKAHQLSACKPLLLRVLIACTRHSAEAATRVAARVCTGGDTSDTAGSVLSACASERPMDAARLARALFDCAPMDGEAAMVALQALHVAIGADPSLSVRIEALLGARAALLRCNGPLQATLKSLYPMGARLPVLHEVNEGDDMCQGTLALARKALLSATAAPGAAPVEYCRAAGLCAIAATPAAIAAELGAEDPLVRAARVGLGATAEGAIAGARAAIAACDISAEWRQKHAERGGGSSGTDGVGVGRHDILRRDWNKSLAAVAASSAQLHVAARALTERPWGNAVFPDEAFHADVEAALESEAVGMLVKRVCADLRVHRGTVTGEVTLPLMSAVSSTHAMAMLSSLLSACKASPDADLLRHIATDVVDAAGEAVRPISDDKVSSSELGCAPTRRSAVWVPGGASPEAIRAHLALQRGALVAQCCAVLPQTRTHPEALTPAMGVAIMSAAVQELAALSPGDASTARALIEASLGHEAVTRAVMAPAFDASAEGPPLEQLASAHARHASDRLLAALDAETAGAASAFATLLKRAEMGQIENGAASPDFGTPLAAVGKGSSLPWLPTALVLPLLPKPAPTRNGSDEAGRADHGEIAAAALAVDEPLRTAAVLALLEGTRAAAGAGKPALLNTLAPSASTLVCALKAYAYSVDYSLFLREGVAERLPELVASAASGLPPLALADGETIPALEGLAGRLAERFSSASYGDEGFARAAALMLSPAVSPSMAQAAAWRVLSDGDTLRMLPRTGECLGGARALTYPGGHTPASDVLAAQEEAARDGRMDKCEIRSVVLALFGCALGAVVAGESPAPDMWKGSLSSEAARRRALVGVLAGCRPRVAGAALLGLDDEKRRTRRLCALRGLLDEGDALGRDRLAAAFDESNVS